MKRLIGQFWSNSRIPAASEIRFADPPVPQEALDVLLKEFPQLFVPGLCVERDRPKGELALSSFKHRNVFGPLSCFGMTSEALEELWGLCAGRYGHEPDAVDFAELTDQVLNDVPLLDLRWRADPSDFKDWRHSNRFSLIEVINLCAALREVRHLGSVATDNVFVERVDCYEAQHADGFIALATALARRIDAPLPPPRADTASGVFGIMRGHECGDADAILTATRSGGGRYRLWIDPIHPLTQPIYPWFGDWNPAYLVEDAADKIAAAFLELLEIHVHDQVHLRLPDDSARELSPSVTDPGPLAALAPTL